LEQYDNFVMLSLSVLFVINIALMLFSRYKKWEIVFMICLQLLYYFLSFLLYLLIAVLLTRLNLFKSSLGAMTLAFWLLLSVVVASLIHFLFIKLYHRFLHYPVR